MRLLPKEVGRFLGGYTLRRLRRGLYLYIPDQAPLTFERPNGQWIVVSEHLMTTDLGSVPRWLWWLPGLAPNDLERPSIVHDALYDRHKLGDDRIGFTEANQVLYEACIAEGYGHSMAWAIREACNRFGRPVWDGPRVTA